MPFTSNKKGRGGKRINSGRKRARKSFDSDPTPAIKRLRLQFSVDTDDDINDDTDDHSDTDNNDRNKNKNNAPPKTQKNKYKFQNDIFKKMDLRHTPIQYKEKTAAKAKRMRIEKNPTQFVKDVCNATGLDKNNGKMIADISYSYLRSVETNSTINNNENIPQYFDKNNNENISRHSKFRIQKKTTKSFKINDKNIMKSTLKISANQYVILSSGIVAKILYIHHATLKSIDNTKKEIILKIQNIVNDNISEHNVNDTDVIKFRYGDVVKYNDQYYEIIKIQPDLDKISLQNICTDDIIDINNDIDNYNNISYHDINKCCIDTVEQLKYITSAITDVFDDNSSIFGIQTIIKQMTESDKSQIEPITRHITLNKIKSISRDISLSKEWKHLSRSLKLKHKISYQTLTNVSVFKTIFLKSHPAAIQFDMHQLSPSYSCANTQRKTKKDIQSRSPDYVTLYDIKDILKDEYHREIPDVNPDPEKKKVLKCYPYSAIRTTENIVNYLTDTINDDEYNGIEINIDDDQDEIYPFVFRIGFDGASRRIYFIKKLSVSHTIGTFHSPFYSKNNQSPYKYQLHALYYAPENGWNIELFWKHTMQCINSLIQSGNGHINIHCNKLNREIKLELKIDLITLDSPSISAILGGNEVGATYFDPFINGMNKNKKLQLLELSMDDIEDLYVDPIEIKIRDIIRNIFLCNKSQNAYETYCKFNEFPRIVCIGYNTSCNDFYIEGKFDERRYPFTTNFDDYFKSYQLKNIDDSILDDRFIKIIIHTKDLKIIRDAVNSGESRCKLKLSKLNVEILYGNNNNNDEDDVFDLIITDNNGKELFYMIDGPHCMFHENMCDLDIVFICILHIVENIGIAINEIFIKFIIAIYTENEHRFNTKIFCDILRKYNLFQAAAEFADKLKKFDFKHCKLTGMDAINFICNFSELINDIIISMNALTNGDVFILLILKYFVNNNGKLLDQLWNARKTTSDIILNIRIDAMSIIHFLDQLLPSLKLINPKWYRYCFTAPFHVFKVHRRYPNLSLSDICMQGLEHLHKLIKNMTEQISKKLILSHDGVGCAEVMNNIDFSEKTVFENNLTQNQRSKHKIQGCSSLGALERKMKAISIRGCFFRKKISGSTICYCIYCNAAIDVGHDDIDIEPICDICDEYKNDINIIHSNYVKLKEQIKLNKKPKPTQQFIDKLDVSMSQSLIKEWQKDTENEKKNKKK